MNAIIRCIFTLVSLNQLNGSAGYHFYLTSHPNVTEYLENMQSEKTPHGPQPPIQSYCKMLKESRIFKAADTEAPNFQLLDTDWDTLLNFTDPSLVVQENCLIKDLSMDLENEIDKLGLTRLCNSQILCFKNSTYEYYLVFEYFTSENDDQPIPLDIILHYDKFLFVRYVESKETVILGLVQIHTRGFPPKRKDGNCARLESNYTWIIGKKPEELPQSQQYIAKKSFCSMNKYHVLNYCSRVLNWFWDWTDEEYKEFPSIAKPSPVNFVEVNNFKCVDGKLNLPTQPEKIKDAVFLPCTVKHHGGLSSHFHLTPAGGLFLAKNTSDDNYTIHAYIHPVKVCVKKVEPKGDSVESTGKIESVNI